MKITHTTSGSINSNPGTDGSVTLDRFQFSGGVATLNAGKRLTLGSEALKDLKNAFFQALARNPRSVVVDLTASTAADSSTVGELVAMKKHCDEKQVGFSVAVASDSSLKRLLFITRLDQEINVSNDVASAVDAFKK